MTGFVVRQVYINIKKSENLPSAKIFKRIRYCIYFRERDCSIFSSNGIGVKNSCIPTTFNMNLSIYNNLNLKNLRTFFTAL